MITKRKPLKRAMAKTAVKPAVKAKYTMFRPKVRSRHPSHSPLRTMLPKLPFRSVVRLGSTTVENDVVALGGRRIECNTVQGVKNSASKLLMKQCFTRAGIKTADWWTALPNGHFQYSNGTIAPANLPYPIIAKSHHGSRGEGNTKLNNQAELTNWMRGKTLSNYIFERFYSYAREYRIHVTARGEFYACRKMLKRDAEESNKWQRHDDNCVWILDTNPAFDKPTSWNLIVADCVKALKSLGLDIGAFDVKVQSTRDNKDVKRASPEWIIIESCSAPSFGEITTKKYIEQIPLVLKEKYENLRL